jgi:glycosyltransferase involved in cell wall biosynthesis
MAHTIQVAKMGQALSQQIHRFELVTGGDLKSMLRGIDPEFQEWYGLHHKFKLVRLPVHLRATYPFPQNYPKKHHQQRYLNLATLYAYLKSPSLIYTRSPKLVERFLKLGIPVLWEKHEPIHENSTSRAFFSNKNFVGFITISSSLVKNYINCGLDPEKALVAHSGVDFNNFLPHRSKVDARRQLALPEDRKIIVYSGHLYEYKGIPTLLETARMLPQHLFVLVGGWEEDVSKVEQERNRLGLRNVKLMGHVPQTELASYLYAADVLLLPTSRSWELSEGTSPLKLFEYMVSKRPIVASALPNIMTVLRDKANAILAEPDEPAAFANAIASLLNNSSLANAIAECAYQEVKEFTWERRAERIIQFAQERMSRLDCSEVRPAKNLIRYLKTAFG